MILIESLKLLNSTFSVQTSLCKVEESISQNLIQRTWGTVETVNSSGSSENLQTPLLWPFAPVWLIIRVDSVVWRVELEETWSETVRRLYREQTISLSKWKVGHCGYDGPADRCCVSIVIQVALISELEYKRVTINQSAKHSPFLTFTSITIMSNLLPNPHALCAPENAADVGDECGGHFPQKSTPGLCLKCKTILELKRTDLNCAAQKKMRSSIDSESAS